MNAPCTELTASLLAARSLGVLEAKEQSELATHLASCASCTALEGDTEAALAELSVEKVSAPDVWAGIAEELDRKDAVSPQVSLACTYCKDQLVRERSVFCAQCLAPHHEDCFVEHGRCSACRERRFVQPSAPVARPWTRRLAPVLLVACGAGVAAAALRLGVHPAGAPPVAVPVAFTPAAPAPATPAPATPAPATPRAEVEPAAPAAPLDDTVTLDVVDADLETVLQEKVMVTRRGQILAMERGLKARVTVKLVRVSWYEAIARVVHAAGYESFYMRGGFGVVRVAPIFLSPGATLADAAGAITSATGLSVIVDPRCAGTKVPEDARSLPWPTLLERTAAASQLNVRAKGDVVVVAANDTFSWGASLFGALAERWNQQFDDRWLLVPQRGRPHSVGLRGDLTLDRWARLIAHATGKTIGLPHESETLLVLDAHFAEADDALDVILAFLDLGVAAETDEAVRVGPLSKTTSLEVKRSVALVPNAEPGHRVVVLHYGATARLRATITLPPERGWTEAVLAVTDGCGLGEVDLAPFRKGERLVFENGLPSKDTTLRILQVSAGGVVLDHSELGQVQLGFGTAPVTILPEPSKKHDPEPEDAKPEDPKPEEPGAKPVKKKRVS